MKTKTTITNLTHEDLVNLLDTACYGSEFFDIIYAQSDYYGTALENEDDFASDKWAKLLLNGKSIKVCDYYSEEEKYGTLPSQWNAKRERMEYTVNLLDIIAGLEKALDSDTYIAIYVRHLVDDESVAFDQIEAEALLQFIVFGEEIYG